MKLPLKLNSDNDIYYNCRKCYSYDYFMNIITGGRGIGKTTSWCIQALIGCKKGNEFITGINLLHTECNSIFL